MSHSSRMFQKGEKIVDLLTIATYGHLSKPIRWFQHA